VNRFFLTLVPLVVLGAGCPPGDIGDSCKDDEDCDEDAGLICEKATDATEDDEGECAEEPAAS
jgi:hypothetical protein